MLDLFTWLASSPLTTLSTEFIDPQTIASKREGFFELTGTLHGQLENGTLLEITDHGRAPAGLRISVETAEGILFVSESSKEVQSLRGTYEKKLPGCFEMKFQSDLTNLVVENLMETGSCRLTPYQEASHVHQIMLDAFSKCFRTVSNEEHVCPIT
jgi:hypothetical protein